MDPGAWRNFGIMFAALAAGLFATPYIRDSLGWPDELWRNLAITLPVMAITHLVLRQLFGRRG